MSILIVLIGISFCTATSLILINKKIMNNYGFECPTFLTSYHFLLSTILLEIMGRLKFFKIDKTVPTIERWTTAAFGVGSIVFLNINLKVNSIGFYQLSKLCNIPMMVAYKLIVKHQTTPRESLISLAVLLVGMALFTVNDVQFSIPGAIVALVAVTSTTVFQSRQAYMQQEYKISGPQLNHLVAFPEFVIGITASFLLEAQGEKGLFNHKFQVPNEILLILLTGVFAVYGNIIGFIMIGKTGPVTFQVIGHTKTILIFVFGLIMFPPTKHETHQQKIKKIAGLIVSMIGVISYTFIELRIKAKERALQLRQAPKLEEEHERSDQDTLFKETKENDL